MVKSINGVEASVLSKITVETVPTHIGNITQILVKPAISGARLL